MKAVTGTMWAIVVVCVVALFIVKTLPRDSDEVIYYTVWADGHKIAIKDFIAVPLWEPNDVKSIWPVFIAEKEVDFPWGQLILQSKPFILSDNPEIQGEYGRRMVYYVKENK